MHETKVEKLLRHHVEVCEDVFYGTQRYQRWLKGEIRLLRCHGGPRSGKTSFAAALAKRLGGNKPVKSIYVGHGSSRIDSIEHIREVKSPTILIIDGLDCREDSAAVEQMLVDKSIRALLVQSRVKVEKRPRCSRCPTETFMPFYRDCKVCNLQYCQDCDTCGHKVELKAAHVNLAGVYDYVNKRVTDKDAVEAIMLRADNSFIEARLLVETWLRCGKREQKAMFDTQDHILKCQIEFYDSLLHNMSQIGLVILSLVAAEVPFRSKELADIVYVLTGEPITMPSLLRDTHHLVDIEWLKVPIVKVSHTDVMAFIREEAELPEIDMVELCRWAIEHIEHAGEFSNYALRNWSRFARKDRCKKQFDNYLNNFENFRERTFLALNDDEGSKFYGTHVDHLKAWHGLPVSSDISDQRESRPIHIAARRGHAHLMPDLAWTENLPNGRGQTAFQIAIENGKLSVCDQLSTDLSAAIEHNENYAMRRITPETDDLVALHTAIRLNKPEIVTKFPQSLRDHEAHILMRHRMPELLGDTEADEVQLQCFANESSKDPSHESKSLKEYADALDSRGRTPLWDAVSNSDKQRIDLLLEHTDVNIVAHNGRTIVEHAWDIDEDIALRLLPKAEKLKTRRLAEMLKYAIQRNRRKSVKTLVMKGADLWAFADIGSLPSEIARSCGADDNTFELVRRMEQIFIKGKKLIEIENLEVLGGGAGPPRR